MSRNAETITYKKEDVLKILADINTIVVSLDRIGSAGAEMPLEDHDRMAGEFVRQWDVFRMLASARKILSDRFSDELGDDDKDELEREMEDVPFWRSDARSRPD
jgi:hypothetical protein